MFQQTSIRDVYNFMLDNNLSTSKNMINGKQGNVLEDLIKNLADICIDKNLMERKLIDMHKIYQKSKGEVYTPLNVITELFNALKGYYPDFFTKPIRFYDGCCGTGNAHVVVKEFLKEGRSHLYENEDAFEIDVITNSLFGNDIQKRNCILSCTNIDPKGLVSDNKNFTCEDFENLIGKYPDNHFDLGFLNPPYAISTTEGKMSSRPFVKYGIFLKEMTRICKVCVFVHPIKSIANRSNTPETNKIVRDIIMSKHVRELHCYDQITSLKNIFTEANISGGVATYIYDKDYEGDTKIRAYYNDFEFEEEMMKDCSEYKKHPTFVYSAIANSIIQKVMNSSDFVSLSSIISKTKPFGFRGAYTGFSEYPTEEQTVFLQTKKSPVAYVSMNDIKNNKDCVANWKCYVAKTNSGSGTFPHTFYSKTPGVSVCVGKPNSCCTESYFLVDGTGKYLYDEESCKNFVTYCYTKFHSFLAYVSTLTQDTWNNSYYHVPLLDFSRKWTDEDLQKKYNLTDEEMSFISKIIA